MKTLEFWKKYIGKEIYDISLKQKGKIINVYEYNNYPIHAIFYGTTGKTYTLKEANQCLLTPEWVKGE